MTGDPAAPLVLAVNPGAGSTKLALYRGGTLVREEKLAHPELLERPARRAWEELPARVAVRARHWRAFFIQRDERFIHGSMVTVIED